jgi:hypothetical protein
VAAPAGLLALIFSVANRFVSKTTLAMGAGISKSPYGAQRHPCANDLLYGAASGCRVAANGDLEIPAPERHPALIFSTNNN